jgi:hypothetical protein
MNIKFKVSKSGKDVSSTNPNDFIMHSDYNSFQILAEGKQTGQSVNADPKTFTIAHGLSWIPAVMAFAKYPDGYVAMAQSGQRTGDFAYIRRFYLKVDNTNLYLIFYKGGGGNYNVDFKYYIFNRPLT